MPTNLTIDEMKAKVRSHFEDFVNNRTDNGAHLYLQEHNLAGWLARLNELERLAAQRGLGTIHPGHGPAGGLSLIQGTREYLQAFETATDTGNAESARHAILRAVPRPPRTAIPRRLQPARLLPAPPSRQPRPAKQHDTSSASRADTSRTRTPDLLRAELTHGAARTDATKSKPAGGLRSRALRG
jgi:hypothetical protein